MVSPDGLRWKLLEEGDYPFRQRPPYVTVGTAWDSQHAPFWDNDLGKYVSFIRLKRRPEKQFKGRPIVNGVKHRQRMCSVGVVMSDDFRKWTYAKEILVADENMPVPGGDPIWEPVVDYYTPVGFKVPGVPHAYVCMPTTYYHWQEDGLPQKLDTSIMTSRDLTNWWQPEPADREPFLRLGPDGSKSSGMVFANPWPVVVGNEIWIYYTGTSANHEQHDNDSPSAVYRGRLRLDGFVSVNAGYRGGEFTTPLVKFEGTQLKLNMDSSAGGWLQVEVLSPQGTPMPGYSLDQCDTIQGNSVKKIITWQGKSDVSGLADKPVRLRFVMQSTKLYAFQFVE